MAHHVRVVVSSLILLSAASAQIPTLQPRLGRPVNGLTAAELQAFETGKVQFDRVFQASDGLGPAFNQNSCASCHSNPIGGSGSIFVRRFGNLDPKTGLFDPLDALGGSLLQAQGLTGCAEVVPAAANITAMRITPSILGDGLIEAIPDSEILSNATNGLPGTTGRAHLVPLLEDPNAPLRPGKFGWKAQIATLLSFSADASLNEMGITNRILPQELAPNGNVALLMACDLVADPEDTVVPGTNLEFIDHITLFQQYVAAPPQTPRSGMAGEALFSQIGCADCHRPQYVTSNDPGLIPALRGQTIRPYSDFLLHDMGLAADFIGQGGADPQELRTPPLWGLRIREALWHDGRVTGVDLAARISGAGGVIDLHDALLSQARGSAQAFRALSGADQNAIIAFLDSLGREEFDFDGDREIDEVDLAAFDAARSAPGTTPYTPNDPEAVFDVDQDGDVDDDDFAGFVEVYEVDCNGNGIGDLLDILVYQTSTDVNGNRIPDECETCAPSLGSQGPGPFFMRVCGDDLTTPGSLAAFILEGTPGANLTVAVSASMSPLPAAGGGVVLPALPWLEMYSVTLDGSGRFTFCVAGGSADITTFFVQAGRLEGGIVELSNALEVTAGR